jgi:SnoaL-like protein
MTREQCESFAAQWAQTWNHREIEAVLALFDDNIVFTSPTAAAVVGTPIVRGKDALRSYWAVALGQITSLQFSILRVVWDPISRELAIVYTSSINGQAKRVAENLTFKESGLIGAVEVFHGVAEET